MIENGYFLLLSWAGIAGLFMTFTFFMFRNLKEDVRRQIEAGTEEHREFRQGLKDHAQLFRVISENLGKLTGQMEIVIDLLRQQSNK